jgi:CheY-like chemotaxis protein
MMTKINCILLVDDNEADNVLHKIVLDDANVCNYVKVATDGVNALEYIINAGKPGQEAEYPKPDLILLDINMPRMNGFEFLDEYHKLDERLKAKVTIVMLTTSLNPEDKKTATSYTEVKGFETKPLTLEILNELLEKYF